MGDPVVFTIPGKPFAKQRPRGTRSGHFYTPGATVSFERTVGQYALAAITEPLTGPVKVSVLATFKPAKSWTKKRRAAALDTFHTQKPDADNLMKAILDGMNRIAFADDAQVAEQFVRKLWGEEEKTVVIVEALS